MSTNDTQMHEAMLRKYNPDNHPWWQIPDDGYLYDHLAHHLLGAGRSAELVTLLTASPDWLETRCQANNCASFLADVDLALKPFADPLEASQLLELVQLYTVKQVAHVWQNTYGNNALKILVWLDRKDEALNHARWQSTAEDQCQRLLTVHNALRAKGQPDVLLLDEMYALSATITDDIQQRLVRDDIVQGYAQAGQFDTAETIARSFAESHDRADALRVVARGLARAKNERASEIFAAALAEARSLDEAYWRAEYLYEIAYGMSKAEGDRFAALRAQARDVFLEAQQAIESLPSNEQTILLRDLVYHMAWAGHLVEAEIAARRIQDDLWLADALGQLAEIVAESDREHANALFNEAEEVVRRIEDTFDLVVALRDLARNMAKGKHNRAVTIFAEAREAIYKIRLDNSTWVTEPYQLPRAVDDLLDSLVRALAYAGMDAELKEFSESIDDPNSRALALASAVGILAEDEQFDVAEQIANMIGDDHLQASALVSLGDNLAQVDKARATIMFARAANAFGIATHNDRAWALGDLGKVFAQLGDKRALPVFAQSRAMIRNIPRLDERARWMGLLVSSVLESSAEQEAYHHLASGILAEAQTIIQDITDGWNRIWEPLNLTECYAEKGFCAQAEAMARLIEDNSGKAIALGHTAAALQKAHNTEQAVTVVNEAMMLARQIENLNKRSNVLNELSKVLAWAGFHTETEALIRDITDPDDKAVALCELSEALTEAKQFEEALRIAQEIEDDDWRGWALGALAPEMAEAGLFAEAEAAARMLPDHWWSLNSLRTLTHYMAKAGDFAGAERVARSVQDGWRRARAFDHLTVALFKANDDRASTMLAETLTLVSALDDKWEQADVLRELAADLAEENCEQADSIFTKAIIVAQSIDDLHMKQVALNEMATALAEVGRYSEARTLAHTIKDDDMRLRTLRAVASTLADEERYAVALEVFGPCQLDDWIDILVCGGSSANKINPAVISAILREVLRLLGWVSPDYRAVYEHVMAAED